MKGRERIEMTAESNDLDSLLSRVDPDRWLATRFIADPQARAEVVAVYAYDHELARAPRTGSNPLLGEIRLTWWREALDEIFEGRAVRRHPTAQALAAAVGRHGLARAPLEAMIDARYGEFEAQSVDAAEALRWANDTGGQAAELCLAILDPAADPGLARPAGAAWALARRVPQRPDLAQPFAQLLAQARRDARRLTAAGFPAVAHAVFAAQRARGSAPSGLPARLRITWAVARGRI
jgi:phytoene synthase